MSDNINHPEHYIKGKIKLTLEFEPIEIACKLDFCGGNIIKYLMRAPYKGNELEDLQKALFYAKYRAQEDTLEVGENDLDLIFNYSYDADNKLVDLLQKQYPIIFEVIYGSNSVVVEKIQKLIDEVKSRKG